MKPSRGISIIAYLEMLSVVAGVIALLHIDKYPFALIIWSIPIALLGLGTIKLKPIARKMNLILSPFVVVIYISGAMIIIEQFTPFKFNLVLFYIFLIVTLIVHIYFFSHQTIIAQFDKRQQKGKEEGIDTFLN
ncbi:MAG: hypothetical protein KJ722_02155 [Candidatus Omnitrophica bacterium]|nr:hypothetical protein [Candidatus Omnitrophota bacterium]MBU2221400.1 hypothetical protein [Candidatus Omnitrophota bacterium]MBU2258742.1 hypothetical protein [Candidatus Omnitrophota bacterium]